MKSTSSNCLAIVAAAPRIHGDRARLEAVLERTNALDGVARTVVCVEGQPPRPDLEHLELVHLPPGSDGSHAEVARHVVRTLRAQGFESARVLFVPSSTQAHDLTSAGELFRVLGEERADSAIPVQRLSHGAWARTGVDGAARVTENAETPLFVETGTAYLTHTTTLETTGSLSGGRVALHVVPHAHVATWGGEFGEAVLRALPAPTHAIVFDFDGVFTDNRVFVDETGKESVACSRGDGLGLTTLRQTHVKLLVLSKEQNPVVSARAAKLKLECMQGVDDKPRALAAWLERNGLDAAHVVYVGNDLNDVGCMRMVGCALAPSDSHPTALRAATAVLSRAGGQGAVREVCDAVLAQLGLPAD